MADVGTARASLRTLESHSERVTSVAFSPDDKQIVSESSEDGPALRPRTGEALQTLKGIWAMLYRSFSY